MARDIATDVKWLYRLNTDEIESTSRHNEGMKSRTTMPWKNFRRLFNDSPLSCPSDPVKNHIGTKIPNARTASHHDTMMSRVWYPSDHSMYFNTQIIGSSSRASTSHGRIPRTIEVRKIAALIVNGRIRSLDVLISRRNGIVGEIDSINPKVNEGKKTSWKEIVDNGTCDT